MPKSLSHVALLVVVASLLIGVRVLRQEHPIVKPALIPTASTVIQRIEHLGGEYRLNDLGQVTFLNLKCLPISDDDLEILYDLPHLKTLNLRGINVHKGYRFSNAGLRHVSALKELVTLDLSANGFLTDDGISHLTGCTQLKRLNLRQTRTGAGCFPYLTQLPNLEHLSLSYDPLNEETLPYLQQMSLKSIRGLDVADEDIHLLAELPSLQFPLGIHRKINDTDLKSLKSHLKYHSQLDIVLTKGWADTSGLIHLEGLSRLHEVRLADYKYPEPYIPNNGPLDLTGFKTLATLPNLKRLDLPLEDRFLAARAMCPSVEQIHLSASDFLTRQGLEIVPTMPSLKDIRIHESLVCEETLELVSRVKSLEKLTLQRDYPIQKSGPHPGVAVRPEAFTLQGLKSLTRLKYLKELWLNDWGIDDEMLGVIGQMTSLEYLYLGGTTVTDAGMIQLRHLWNLQKLGMYGSREISQDVCYQLVRYMPNCTIEDMWCCGCMSIEGDQYPPSYLW